MKLSVCIANLITRMVQSHTKMKWKYFQLEKLYKEW